MTTAVRWTARAAGLALVALAVLVPGAAHADNGHGRGARPFAVVVERVLDGDLVMAASSNLRSAGGWDKTAAANADVDADKSRVCVRRQHAAAVCSDNSSSALLDIPDGARVVRARLYVETALSADAGHLRVRLDGPRSGFAYTVLDATSPKTPKVSEVSASTSSRAVMRQTVWDVTGYVATHGPGRYTVADIVNERAGPYLPYASWAIVAAYELDPAVGIDDVAAATRPRFATRAVSWHDGFVRPSDRGAGGPIAELAIDPDGAVFAKSLHIVAAARRDEADNLLFNGEPLGNNATPGDGAPPAGVTIGRNASCNSTTDVFNETVCSLGSPVRAKRPSPDAYVASSDGASPSSGSAVDMDVIRIPDRYLVPGSGSAVFSATTTTRSLAVGMLAVSADLGPTS